MIEILSPISISAFDISKNSQALVYFYQIPAKQNILMLSSQNY